jgi:hypothetical protein
MLMTVLDAQPEVRKLVAAVVLIVAVPANEPKVCETTF